MKGVQEKVKRGSEKERYTEAVGRRKTAVARVRLFSKGHEIKINDREVDRYFPSDRSRESVRAPLKLAGLIGKLGVSVQVRGGGISAQAEAIRLGIARALLLLDATLKQKMRAVGYLTRDPRTVERKKYGLKKARRAPQWAKR